MSNPTKFPHITIHLINRRLGYGSVETPLQGYSGANWGKACSRYSKEYACHFIPLTLEEFEACREDVFKAAHLSARVWEPKIIVTESPAMIEFRAGYELGMDGLPLPDEASIAARAGYQSAQAEQGAEVKDEGGSMKDEGLRLHGDPEEVARLKDDAAYKEGVRMIENGGGGGDIALIFEPITEKTPFPTLQRIARQDGVKTTGINNAAALFKAITEHRAKLTAALVEKSKELAKTKPQGALA